MHTQCCHPVCITSRDTELELSNFLLIFNSCYCIRNSYNAYNALHDERGIIANTIPYHDVLRASNKINVSANGFVKIS